MIYNFNVKQVPKLNQVGGKAKALIETTKAGFPVPQGIVLSVEFFEQWLKIIKSSDEWGAMFEETTKENCDYIKAKAANMTFSDKQSKVFNGLIKALAGDVFAVRSSSPEEDLKGTSFAGMYETSLGVLRSGLEKAVAYAFSSCFDFRVMEYKKQNSMSLDATQIAVIVQRQIASDVSGVGFSLNPLNNAYDEVVINASFGLGEAIVSGIVTPDTYIVDTVKGEIIEKKINEKKIGLWLKSDSLDSSGIEQKDNVNATEQALTDEQIIQLSKLIKKCESYYDLPMDTEWTFENGKLYLLQSRPITTYLPLFPELVTKPDEKKRIYIDIMAMTQGFTQPMSVLGLDLWADMLYRVKAGMITPQVGGTAPAIHGREYMSVTDYQKLLGKMSTKKIIESYDGNVRKIFEQIGNIDHLVPDKKPEGTKGFVKKMSKMTFAMLPGMLKAMFFDHKEVIAEYNKIADGVIENAKSLDKDADFHDNVGFILSNLEAIMGTISAMMAGMISQASIKRMFKGEELEKDVIALSMDLDGNPTSAMGHLLYKMACYDEIQSINARDEFIEKAESRNFSQEFLKDYDEFMDKYAVRGFMEIDVASKRVYEDVGMLYDKLCEINIEDNQITKVKEKRKVAYDKLLKAARAKGKEKKYIKAAEKFQATFGYREHPKYVIVYIYAMLHNICLEIAEDWVESGRLDEPYHIFDFKADEIAKAQKDSDFDLRAIREKNIAPYKKVAHIKDWPLVIDSRGKIYKPKMEIKDGDIVGDPIAPGKVRGIAKVLRTPYEKPLLQGEILVTTATEPSWTPIFINAAGVVMEIGGPLQHGGIIAREYGIPCVSGLIGIMDIIKDGDLLEVDGSNGMVKIITE